jgi:hypothetical protein
MAAFHTFTPWNWLLVGGTYTEEITREAAQVRNRYALLGLIALVLFAGVLFLLVRSSSRVRWRALPKRPTASPRATSTCT